MKVRYIHESPLSGGGKQMSNVMWEGKWPIKHGELPSDHPCLVQSESLESFMQRGYWASTFPEGDGITVDARLGQSAGKVIRDIEECFGWEVIGSTTRKAQ
ncbi:hypothetical protein [Aeoliella mucimassa]|uniref:Uncharacterized protein n=1 Tax=Aeoliella mucimassa TaxID=2527972 RepID=A0A518APT1_9BACT|nr:hypothetical protein [Aeoliella mucimassa]QDU56725.1 hypothetical protein Pan181_29350 [Aeoliella mucimassa]